MNNEILDESTDLEKAEGIKRADEERKKICDIVREKHQLIDEARKLKNTKPKKK